MTPGPARRRGSPAALLALVLALVPWSGAAVTVPDEFADEMRASGLEQPVNFDFLPRIAWDGRAADGRAVAAGIYFATLALDGVGDRVTRRILRLPGNAP